MPFLAGERACIGRGFAEKEYMCLLAVIIQHVDLDLAPECVSLLTSLSPSLFPPLSPA
jgi:cytochrome P450